VHHLELFSRSQANRQIAHRAAEAGGKNSSSKGGGRFIGGGELQHLWPQPQVCLFPFTETARRQRQRHSRRERRAADGRGRRTVPAFRSNIDDRHRHQAAAPDESGDEAGGGLAVELVRRAELFQAALVQERHTVAEVERLLLLVRDQQGGDADPPQGRRELAPGALTQRRVEVRQRLVEQQHARLRREGAGERHALLLPAGDLADPPALEARQVHAGECRRDARRDLRLRQPARLEAEGDVLPHREVREKGVVLEDHAEVALRRRQALDRLGTDPDRAAIGGLETGDDAQQRRLAAPRRSQEGQHLAARHGERDAVEDGLVAELLADVGQDQVGPGGRSRAHRASAAAAPLPRTVRSQVAIHSCPFAAASASS
jgi:hypothetical protein